jgi:two-component system, NarL family, nitrate/nitrite response regulator NarL
MLLKILIADDHALFRDALAQYLERADPQMHIKLAKDFYEVMNLLSQDPAYDLVILDLGMPGMNRLQGIEIIRDAYPKLRVALMSGIAEPQDVRDALSYGIAGYFPKTLSGKTLVSAIERVIGGQIYIPEDKKKQVLMPSYYNDEKTVNRTITLKTLNFTPRELEVLGFLVGGASNKDIARAINLQVVTIKLHVRGICRKMNVQNRTQAALLAKDLGVKPLVAHA